MELIDALSFEREWESRSGSKAAAIRAAFNLPAARYYQQLYSWLDDPTTLERDPLLVQRLIRLRDQRARQRASRGFGLTAAF